MFLDKIVLVFETGNTTYDICRTINVCICVSILNLLKIDIMIHIDTQMMINYFRPRY